MADKMVRAIAGDGQIRAFAATTRDTVEAARIAHNTSPVATAALGRLLTGAAMMGFDLKGEKDLLTIQIECSGPIKGLIVTADPNGDVKGYVYEPDVMLPPNDKGKLDVGGALGLGVLSVVKDIGLKEPYIGQCILMTGEIAEDLAYYFATSEQVPSTVALGVLMNRDNTVRQAGGFIVQLMPDASDEIIDKLEKTMNDLPPVTSLLDEGTTPEELLESTLGEFGLEILGEEPVRFHCDCDRDRVERALISVGREELKNMIDEGEPAEVCCQFCGKAYTFSVDDLKELFEKAS